MWTLSMASLPLSITRFSNSAVVASRQPRPPKRAAKAHKEKGRGDANVIDVLHMNGGAGRTSYASNSLLQKKVLEITRPMREKAMVDLCSSSLYPSSLCIADMGCPSGPNTFLVVSELIETLHETYKNLGKQTPESQIYLNDLPMNDFNTIFKSLQRFQEKIMKKHVGSDHFNHPCFVAGVPGSFHARLFPANSLHFVHSSYSLMWLSKVPEGVGESNGRNIYLATSSPPNVIKADSDQFHNDFSAFLKCRSKELVGGGRMILTMAGRESDAPTSKESVCYAWELVAHALAQLESEGLIEEEELNSFNLPYYAPSAAEVKSEVLKQGSFTIDQLEVSTVKWSVCKNQNPSMNAGHNVAHTMRAALEPLFASHFGEAVMDEVFRRYGDILADRMAEEDPGVANVTVSLTRKF